MERIAQAVGYFGRGYNCAQSVVMTYAPLYGVDVDRAEALSGGFGGGTGGLREACGAWQGIVIVAGLALGYDHADPRSKAEFYRRIRAMHDKFVSRAGSDNCAELLRGAGTAVRTEPSARTPAYYAGRPCARLVAAAAEIIEEELLS